MADAKKNVATSGFSDNELVALVREGDSNAVDVLLSKYKSTVSYYANKFFSDSLTFDDWFQEGMIGLFYAIRTYNADEGASFATYASVCIKNRLSSCLKKVTNTKNPPSYAIVPYEEALNIAVNSVEDDYIAKENCRSFEEVLLKQLSKTEQSVMKYYLAGFTYAEIAKQLDISVKAVDNAVCRAKSKLKKHRNLSV